MEELVTKGRQSPLSSLLRKKSAIVGIAILVIVFVSLALGPVLVRTSPYKIFSSTNSPPSFAHLFGTDNQGHDLLSQIVYGAYPSLTLALEAAIGASILGFFAGLCAGYFGKLETPISILTDAVLTYPVLPVVLLISSLFTTVALLPVFLSLFLWAPICRAVRVQVRAVKKMPFVDASKTSGMDDLNVMIRIIAPEVVPLAIAYFILDVAIGVILITALEFLGIGNPNVVSWGSVLYWASRFGFDYGDWWWIVEPGIIISIVSMGFALVGFSVEEIMNPRLRGK